MDYSSYLDADLWAYIKKTESFHPADLRADDWPAQRAAYNQMAAHFRAERPAGLTVRDDTIGSVGVRYYGAPSSCIILYAHGGGFVLGDLDSHDDVCVDMTLATGCQVVSIDYRLAPEHPHPADYEDMMTVVQHLASDHQMVLCGDSAGATLCASLCGTWHSPNLLGQVLIYPCLGYPMSGGSFDKHAHAPLMTLEELLTFAKLRDTETIDGCAIPRYGALDRLPTTHLFPAECDPLHDDAVRYHADAIAAGSSVYLHSQQGLVHGWLRARHSCVRAKAAFEDILEALKALSR
ncbi:alpha/beta hydrolase fold domain-containing protein [uncultured Cohaesibacter sp.]|uniref:alpha/beta hydrolase fold domain-containing protein n=1 Tax=uncultured Cohaesibacter sp. TaxID=1002546 RepID=UPI0029C91071|nr:alpha/beta hydrolase fold domain-containing protein [uncultured Cohaesibacter sp.]